MKKAEKTNKPQFWKVLLAVLALLLVAAFAVSVCFDLYGSLQKLDNSLKFGSFTFTGLYDKMTGRTEDRKTTITVAVDNSPAIKITSQNPVEVAPGGSVTFTYEEVEGYRIDSFLHADGIEGGVITVSDVKFPTTVAILSHKLERTGVSVEVADFADGYGELPGTVSCDITETWSETMVELHAKASDCFEFVCYTIGAPASAGGQVVADTPDAVCETVAKDTRFYANFRRTHAVITLVQSDGLIIKTPATLTAKLGAKVFFALGTEEGVVIDNTPDDFRFENNVLYVDEVTKPETIVVETRRLAKYTLILKNSDPASGNASLSIDKNYVYESEFVTASAFPAEHRQFLGWSFLKPLDQGGALLSTEEIYTFTLSKDMLIYANFGTVEYTVSIEDYPGLEIISDNPMKVVAGMNAEFEFKLAANYKLDVLPEGVTIYDGKLVYTNVLADTVLYIHTYKNEYPSFELILDSASFGSVTCSHTAGKYNPGTEISLMVTGGSQQFAGWSVGTPYSKGGKIISTSTIYSYTLNSTTKLYANFTDPASSVKAPDGKAVVLYYPNGGVCSSSTTPGYFSDTQSVEFYYCPNALPNNGTFTREGYVLLGYSTNADGTGDFYGPGWNITLPKSRVVSLFCVWKQQTDTSKFTYTSTSTEVTLTGYRGSDTELVIPEYIDGKKVVKIQSGFITGNSSIKSIVFGRTMKTIAASAISNCSALTSIWIHDSVTSMPDNWYSACPAYWNFNVLASRYPAHTSECYGTYTVKYDRLHYDPGVPRIVIVSGSNSAYGINSIELEEQLAKAGYNYDVTNFGQNAGTSAAFYIETVAPLLKKGDFLIHEPEINKFQYGYNELSSSIWTIYEGSLEAFSVVDIRHYGKVYSTFATFNAGKGGEKRYDVVSTASNSVGVTEQQINRHGDLSRYKAQLDTDSNWVKWKPTLDKYDAAGGYATNTWKSSVSYITDKTLQAEINRVYDLIAASGAKVLYSFPSIMRISMTKESQIAGGAEQTAIMNAVDQYLHCTRISIPSTYILERNYSYNSIYHITSEGAIYRSDRLAEDLIAYFKK